MIAHQVEQITPFMHVRDLAAALDFFVNTLGFRVAYREESYSYVTLGKAAIRILEVDCDEEAPPLNGFRYYIDVADADAVHAALKPKLDLLPAGHVMGPKDQTYGQRELMIRAPDGGVLVFGAAIRQG